MNERARRRRGESGQGRGVEEIEEEVGNSFFFINTVQALTHSPTSMNAHTHPITISTSVRLDIF